MTEQPKLTCLSIMNFLITDSRLIMENVQFISNRIGFQLYD